ncbi:sulfite exporter TauE/SafE family protein [Asticcacaulis sp. AC402]|uniref:sulfite exporter TauE/SafE family protein n=1 Tax=Asticcacaulis sp. AC402 TaxID=1282361 RepID=UPI0003C40E32|nr:sulfite exporter TauE/SafE family protein [Asticcacaulis sp. AC402]ESQ77668.1 hypothetical protein ABAC402_00640 [Asticcacaulis sp. AC402]
MDIWGWIQACGGALPLGTPLVLALFIAGLGGSLTHCATMCSGFVLGQSAEVRDQGGFARLLLPYHLGRATTYAALGAVSGISLRLVASGEVFVVLRHLLLVLVALTFLAVFAERFLRKAGLSLPALPLPRPSCAVSAMARLTKVRGTAGRFGLGLALGLLPCPVVFAALMASAAHGDPWLGAAGLFAFALGTMPALMGIGLAGGQILNSHPRLRDGLSLAALGINGVVLLALSAT